MDLFQQAYILDIGQRPFALSDKLTVHPRRSIFDDILSASPISLSPAPSLLSYLLSFSFSFSFAHPHRDVVEPTIGSYGKLEQGNVRSLVSFASGVSDATIILSIPSIRTRANWTIFPANCLNTSGDLRGEGNRPAILVPGVVRQDYWRALIVSMSTNGENDCKDVKRRCAIERNVVSRLRRDFLIDSTALFLLCHVYHYANLIFLSLRISLRILESSYSRFDLLTRILESKLWELRREAFKCATHSSRLWILNTLLGFGGAVRIVLLLIHVCIFVDIQRIIYHRRNVKVSATRKFSPHFYYNYRRLKLVSWHLFNNCSDSSEVNRLAHKAMASI